MIYNTFPVGHLWYVTKIVERMEMLYDHEKIFVASGVCTYVHYTEQ